MHLPFSRHKIAIAVVDAASILLGNAFAFWYVFASGLYYRSRPFPRYFLPSLVVMTAIFLIAFQLEGLYKYQILTDPPRHVALLARCYARVLGIFVVMVFFMKTEYIADSRLTVGLAFLSSFAVICACRAGFLPRVFYLFVRKGIIKKRALIVGAGSQGAEVCRYLEGNPRSYFEIAGFCDDDAAKTGAGVAGRRVLGTSREIAALAREHAIKEVIIAVSNIDKEELLDLIDRCKEARLVVHVISDLFINVYEKLEAEEFGGLITYRVAPDQKGVVLWSAKRLADFFGALFLLIVLAPLFAVVALAVRKDSPGRVFYRSEVVGKGGKHFTAYKFRSMVDGAERADRETYEAGRQRHINFMRDFIQGRTGDRYYVADESRITRAGRMLRKFSLDELPQLFNVLKGDMSLVGPRFCSPVEYSFYKPWHKRRLQVKPGMTGLWQVRGRSAVSYDDMVMLDLYYVQNLSLLLDAEILLRTLPVAIRGKGARIAEAGRLASGRRRAEGVVVGATKHSGIHEWQH